MSNRTMTNPSGVFSMMNTTAIEVRNGALNKTVLLAKLKIAAENLEPVILRHLVDSIERAKGL